MDPIILPIISSIIGALFIFLGQRAITQRDKRLEQIETDIKSLKEIVHSNDKIQAVSASKIEDIKQTMERIYDKIDEA